VRRDPRDFLPLKDLVFRSLVEERDQPARPQVPDGKRGTAPSRFFRLTALGREVAKAETHRLEALVARSRAGLLLGRRR
jgi:hypothetical protein